MSINAEAAYNFDKIRITLSQNNPIQTIVVSNPEKDEAVNLQLSYMLWKQVDGEDVYTPSKDLIIAPPIIKMPPLRNQITRIGWRAPKPIPVEIAYRLFVNDLTAYKLTPNVVRFKVKSSIPVFIQPTKPIFQTQWQLKSAGGGVIKLLVKNTGNIHVQITGITLSNANNDIIANSKVFAYILAGQSKEIPVTLSKPASGTIKINANTDNGQIQRTVPVS